MKSAIAGYLILCYYYFVNRLVGPYNRTSEAVELIKKEAYKRVDKFYGPEGIHPKPYHNLDHTRAVVNAAEKIAELGLARGLMKEADLALVTIAAAWHDARHGHKRNNEYISARYATLAMNETGVFSRAQRMKVYEMILGTEIVVENGRVKQRAQLSRAYLPRVTADADLHKLGSEFDEYFDSTTKLYEEAQGQPGTEAEIAIFGLGFISGHNYLTKEARELYPHQDSNATRLQVIAKTA